MDGIRCLIHLKTWDHMLSRVTNGLDMMTSTWQLSKPSTYLIINLVEACFGICHLMISRIYVEMGHIQLSELFTIFCLLDPCAQMV